ncbi:modulator protein [Haematobacter massiliensis]|uniref:Modulator protein n=1 Tax=Haematobacter massiliensis TaxID=195105 RepID=A0A086Y0Z7_9RHOB|nr:TldD/PmbA family protein [Haematobacter massiliensis]KFI27947.1 modulator protein [Haematobacter massiliensis]OWJ70011.1 modulator protein [Haematobacter massiliensis]OWJ87103.1 modulator protein [Haematobacter massiliensis]QBJ23108.1 TldD/PmbA family protein [Haematobacter massiliensis]
MADLEKLTVAVLEAARRAGAEAADALAVDGSSVEVDVRHGRLEQASRSDGVEIGLRVLIGKRQACVSASDISARTLDEIAERAVAMARAAPEDRWIGLADPEQLARDWNTAVLELSAEEEAPLPADLEGRAREAEAAALSHKGIEQAESSATAGVRRIHLATSNGFSGGYARSWHSLSCLAITGTGTGMERDYYADSRVRLADMDTAETIGRIAAERTLERAGARKPATGMFPVLFDERISSSLIGHLLEAVNGSAIARGSSWLRNALGEVVLPEAMSLTEDPLRAGVFGSRPFDAEGLPARPRHIVRDGVLTGWTLDLATGRQLGMESTGNAVRGTSAPPSPGITNVTLSQGQATRDDLLSAMGTGLLVTSFIGATINPNTGDYSRGASGFWVEGGQISYPVNECTIAGNLRDMLARIVPANDARTHLSRVVPSLFVGEMTVAGS